MGVLAAMLAAGGFAVIGQYKYAALCFLCAWIFTILSAAIGFSVFSARARAFWTTCSTIFSFLLFMGCYFLSCPTLTVAPTSAEFSLSGQEYDFRVTNKSADDTYLNSFLFRMDSDVYAISDFEFQVPQESLHPLEQNAGSTGAIPDVFGAFGYFPPSVSDQFFLFYIYHLAPQESRHLRIRLKKRAFSTKPNVEISTEIMSYSRKAVPVSTDSSSSIAVVPAVLTHYLRIEGLFACLASNPPQKCDSRPAAPQVTVPPGCFYFAGVYPGIFTTQKLDTATCEP